MLLALLGDEADGGDFFRQIPAQLVFQDFRQRDVRQALNIDKHDAHVAVRSRSSCGTVFRIFFPVAAKVDSANPHRATSGSMSSHTQSR